MKAVQFSILAFAALGAAQFASLPDCAMSEVLRYLARRLTLNQKPCAANLPPECNLEVGCICRNQGYISGISCCVKTKCSDVD